jgi:hypothetical protein
LELQQSIRADRELALREATQELQNSRMTLERERFELEKVVAERNRVAQEEQRAAAVGNSAFKNAKMQMARNAAEQTASIAEAAARADAERLRIEAERLRIEEDALREQIAGNQSSINSGVSQVNALQTSIAQLSEVITRAVATYAEQQNRVSALQDGEGRRIHNRGRALDEIEGSIDRVAAITPSQRLDIRNSLILAGIQSVSNEMIDLVINAGSGDLRGLEERIRAIESLSIVQEEPMLAFVNAPTNTPRIQSINQGRRLVAPIGESRPVARREPKTSDQALNALQARMKGIQTPAEMAASAALAAQASPGLSVLSAAAALAAQPAAQPAPPSLNSLSARLQTLKNGTVRDQMAFLATPGVVSGLMSRQPANALNFRAFQGPAHSGPANQEQANRLKLSKNRQLHSAKLRQVLGGISQRPQNLKRRGKAASPKAKRSKPPSPTSPKP